MIDCHTHPLGHEGGPYTKERLRSFIEQGIKAGLGGLGFTDHEWYIKEIDPEIVFALREEYPNFKLLLGLEVDYAPSRENDLAKIVQEKPYDYIIGSVHDIEGWGFDHPDYQEEYINWNINHLYEKYFELMTKAVETGLFHLVGHLDLIKVFGYRYEGELGPVVKPLLEAIKNKGMAVELNTNGLNKPIGEFYPQDEILQLCFQQQLPIALSSDAHSPQQIGQYFSQARSKLLGLGFKQIAYFSKGELAFEGL